ncbi:hypothetical protein [Micromonospora sediminimaris]|uniref:Uncharacterized protein n=1 Tax=Micromonospora sediminimaris TaxID=547162 RepID=A0A9W5UL30_9ACTN|nr:hypothetical protein [Micromonospora sediminimaris]GIJ30862.1 hypothetical protein Vse01_00100 [Micromonospora sediminimaris]SFC14928.1 hypothetical protein SAMN05216284_10311 [Micromonospora sediminimaris]
MKPNLARISGKQDRLAEEILARAPRHIEQSFVNSLDPAAALALGRYGARLATLALRQNSVDLLRRSVLATSLARCLASDDDRDFMVALAVPWIVARQLGEDPAEVFAMVGDSLPDGPVARLVHTFGARTDISLEAFGWELVTTADGPDFRPAS